MTVETVQQQLKKLRLATASRELEEVLSRHKKAASLGWLSELLEREIDARHESTLRSRIKNAKFPEITTLESFDFAFNERIKEDDIRALTDLKFIEDNRIVLLLGSTGTGKTHIGIALGVLAARAGHRVFCTSAKRLNAQIMQAKVRNSLDDLFKRILLARLWLIDDWGVISFRREVAEELFDLLDRRKYSSSMILTSNRDIDEWPQVFPDPVIANATIDRIFDRAETIVFEGPSYRLKGKIAIRDVDEKKKEN
jgi:DNA replication protein DnaC